ncbi:MAG TPA: protein kinase [Thermoanaerobaculia bacterium]|jgi:TolB-like protein/tRNA A-37 threonylcarbamoyl transferase component Bud32
MPEVPQAFERFETVRILGKGGMGTVYLARDKTLGRQVALKVLNADDMASEERRSRFLREARAAGAIRHPNVATIYEVDETADGQPFIVMEYCEGETLSQRLRRRALDTAEFLAIARQVASGLAAAHAKGLIHRDIKAANIMIEPTGAVKILDFGLAKFLQQEEMSHKMTFESTSGHFFGTLHYLSPEQARGQQSDARSDLFSTGVVLYQMASGHLPFNADAPLMVLEKIRDAEPEPFTALDPTFPPTAARIIGKLLQKNPEDRYQNASDLAHDLEEIETPTLRLNATSRSTIGRTMRRPPLTKLAAVVAAFIVIAVAIYFIRERNEKLTAADATQQQPAAAGPIRSMAVLPLDNLANNQADEFLSVGIADALVTKLQKIPSLQVRPTSAVRDLKNQKLDVKTAGEKLGVDGILAGRFLAAGDLVRVNLQLTDARSGYNVWADTVDGKRGDLLKLIDDVSTKTVAALNTKIGTPEPSTRASEARSSSPKAFEEYLKGRALAGSFTTADFNAQMNHYKRAIELDPTFAGAYANLALAIAIGTARGQITDAVALSKAEWYARQAVRLDPNLAEAHLALGRVFVRMPGRFREATRENLAALRLAPNDTGGIWVLASYFVSTGDLQKAQCPLDRLVRLDPQANEAKTRGYLNLNMIDPEGALEAAKYALASKDTELAGHDIRGYAFILLGNLPDAEREAAAATALVPKSYLGKSLRAMIAAARGDRPACEALLQSFDDDANHNHWAAVRVALCYAKLGDNAKAIEWLRKAYDSGQHSWYALVKHPWLQPLQADPEFQKILGAIKADLEDVRDDVIGVDQLICK